MLRERAHVIVEAHQVLYVMRVQAKDAARILVRRQSFAAIRKQIGAAEIQLLTCHKVAEFSQLHKAPDHGVVARFQSRRVELNRHSSIWPLSLIFTSARKDVGAPGGAPQTEATRGTASASAYAARMASRTASCAAPLYDLAAAANFARSGSRSSLSTGADSMRQA